MRYLLAAMLFVGFAAVGHADPTKRSIVKHEATYRAACSRDTETDCSRLPELAKLPAGNEGVISARASCDRFNRVMSAFCTVAADHAPESREVLSAVADAIAARKDMVKAIDAARMSAR